MYNVSQNLDNEHNVLDFISRFLKEFHVGKLLFKCNAGKEKGIPVMQIFRYLLCLVFSDRSLFMQMKTGTFSGGFSKNTVYRFLNSLKTNWQWFTTLLSAGIVTDFLKPLTSDERKDVFIVDDSLYDRSRSKKTEMLARVFDHCSMSYKLGYRLLTLGWSDGNSFVPVNYCLLSAADDKNLIYEGKRRDGRSLSERRKRQSRRKATDVMTELVKSAQKAGLSAKYILFDSWFASPKTIISLKRDCDLNTIAMLKKSKAKYGYNGENLNVREIYAKNKKRRGRSKYLLSVEVSITKDNETILGRLVFVRNKGNRKDWLALICTDVEISEEEIIRTYGKRWDIETFFKSCKSYLRLVKECRCISYEALNAHVAIVFTRYMLLAVAQRRNTDDRTICEICYVMMDELEDITFSQSMRIILDALISAVMECFHITESQLAEFTETFISRLPKYMQASLRYDAA